MKTPRRYTVHVRHDKGTSLFVVTSTSKEKAIALVMAAEGCPRRAIIDISPKPDAICPECKAVVWDTATVDQHLNKCWGCGLKFFTEENA